MILLKTMLTKKRVQKKAFWLKPRTRTSMHELQKRHEIHKTAQNSTTSCTAKCATCCTLEFLKNRYFFGFGLVKQAKRLHPLLSNQIINREIPLTW